MPKKLQVMLCALACSSACLAADVKIIEEIVAKVNNEIVTSGELNRSRHEVEAQIERQQLPAERAQAVLKQADANLLRDRIDQLLLVQKAKELDIKVDQDLSKRMAQIQLESKITDPDKFQQYVREQSGMSFEDFKEQMKDNLLTGEVIRREVGSRITISRAEQQKYYEEHKSEFIRDEQVLLQEILISTEGKDAAGVAAAEKKAKDLVARARKGENFGTLARDNSDAETAQNYGELPPFKRGVLKKEIEEIVFNQQRGYVTDPLRQPAGFLILKVAEHYQAGLQPFEAVENEIMEKLYTPRMQPALRAYLTKLRQEAYLQIRAGWVDTGAAPGKDTAWKEPAKLKPETVTKEEVAQRTRRKKLLGIVPIPGTKTTVGSGAAHVPVHVPANPTVAPGTPGAPSTASIPPSPPASQ
jgi:peptidyl-prolyl cis-trans isomerase SurA